MRAGPHEPSLLLTMPESADTLFVNGRIATLAGAHGDVEALAVKDGRVLGVGTNDEMQSHADSETRVVDLHGRVAIPGINDSHLHIIRGGLNFNMELRWDGVKSLAHALGMLREQAIRTPPPQWVRVVGGWSEFQFTERRMPTLAEINAAAPDTPVFVLHLYDRALLNRAALHALGYDEKVPEFPDAEIERDSLGNPTGMLIANPNATVLYATLAQGPTLGYEDQLNSTRLFMHELNRLGVTSAIDAGGGWQSYPDDYRVISDLHERGEMTVRIAYNLFTQRPGQELEDFESWVSMTEPGAGDDLYRVNGAGEMLVFSAADFEDFLKPRPDLPQAMEEQLYPVVRLLAENRWPWRIHATYEESITRFLDVFERVNREVPFDGLRFFLDHGETISERSIERLAALGGGLAIQHRMAFQGEYFIERYGSHAAGESPPVRKILESGVPVAGGTDATRVASYNPWLGLYWLVSGRTIGGAQLYPADNRLDRLEALRLYTQAGAWFSGEEDRKGTLAPGSLADFAVLSEDYFAVDAEEIKNIESVLTVLGGRIVHGAHEFAELAPPLPPASPDWSPVALWNGYQRGSEQPASPVAVACSHAHAPGTGRQRSATLWDHAHGLRCPCFAF
jgi:predicted amidohydrolase YtcJ